MAELTQGSEPERAPVRVGAMVNYAGAAVSLALLIGIGLWGYRLVMRDVTGIPVVRAMEGPMRTAPADPGGEVAPHIGLAVNAVPAMGEAAPPEDTLILAPREVELSEEDIEAQPTAEAGEVVARSSDSGPAPADAAPAEAVKLAMPEAGAEPDTPAPADQSGPTALAAAPQAADAPEAPLTPEEVLALADRIAAGSAPLAPLEAGADAPVATGLTGTEGANRIASSVPGVRRSPRPMERPAALVPALQKVEEVAAVTAPAAPAAPVDPAAIPVGTSLVQLGAYESAEVANNEWVRISISFSDYMDGKQQVVQRATSGGRTFYRLRAMGFADLAEARRFCAVLVDQNAACVPVVVR